MPTPDSIYRMNAGGAGEPDPHDLSAAHAELARLRQNTFWLRITAVIATAGLIALFSVHDRPRFMFVVPMATALLWALDGAATRGARLLERLLSALRGHDPLRPHTHALDVSPWRSAEPFWRNVLHPRVSAVYLPLTLLASLISVDAPVIAPGDRPSELTWYVLVAGCAVFVLLLVGIAALTEAAAAETAVAARRQHAQPPPRSLPPSEGPSRPFAAPAPPPAAVPMAWRDPPAPSAGPFPLSPAPVSAPPAPPPVSLERSGDTRTVARSDGPFPPSVVQGPLPVAGTGTGTLTGTGTAEGTQPRSEPTRTFGTLIE